MSPRYTCFEEVLRYSPNPPAQSTVRRWYLRWREKNGIPYRCDNEMCELHRADPRWNGQPLTLILDHVEGVKYDNSPEKLRFLCPNCNIQLSTNGGRNIGRVRGDSIIEGSYEFTDDAGNPVYTMNAVNTIKLVDKSTCEYVPPNKSLQPTGKE